LLVRISGVGLDYIGISLANLQNLWDFLSVSASRNLAENSSTPAECYRIVEFQAPVELIWR
jgi:hypothetical protein